MSRDKSPFREFEEILERLSKSLEDRSSEHHHKYERGTPAVDVTETDGEFTASIDLPGFDKSDVDVRVAEDTLRVTADREEAEEREGEFLRRERHHRTVSRTISLPHPIDEDEASARMNNGVLTVSLPKVMDLEEDGEEIPIS
ncbi:MAG: Hsp20/alpha crystallin family protein [Halobacteriaceae archaeon]